MVRPVISHITKCIFAGIIAILPVTGTIFVLAYLEGLFNFYGIKEWGWYFPGLALLVGITTIYLLGLLTTTLIGRFVWRNIDRLIAKIPAIGNIYNVIKEVMGFDTEHNRMFIGVVKIKTMSNSGAEIGLITKEIATNGKKEFIIFVPQVPNPTKGRLIIIGEDDIERVNIPVHEAIKTLLLIGKTNFPVKSIRV